MTQSQQASRDKEAEPADAISIVQRGNLRALEKTLRRQWRLGQNIVLCWSADERGLLVIFVPHYFLGNFCADSEGDNEAYIRELVSDGRRRSREELFAVSERLDVAPTFIKLETPLSEEAQVLASVDQLIRRYGISYVESRGVLLFDIVEFSLFTPFEQASQLNSLSYSLNSAYNKLLARGIEVNFARTTTGDGYYVWNRDLGARADRDLFYFLLLVLADNAVARAASQGNTVPVIRGGFHVGSHYELYQAEGVNPTLLSYIVGDVTIELARMVDLASADQVLVGDFECADSESALGGMLSAPAFVGRCNRALGALAGLQLSGKPVERLRVHLTGDDDGPDCEPRRFRITDKHGLARSAYNLQLEIEFEGRSLALGLDAGKLPGRSSVAENAGVYAGDGYSAPSTERAIDDLEELLGRRRGSLTSED